MAACGWTNYHAIAAYRREREARREEEERYPTSYCWNLSTQTARHSVSTYPLLGCLNNGKYGAWPLSL